jgi:hypothetical protein
MGTRPGAQDPSLGRYRPQSRKLFIDTLGLPLEKYEADEYYSSESIPGSKHFGVWPFSQAAEACFGTPKWPADRVVPRASIEFEAGDAEAVAAAGGELERAGFELVHPARTGPWGQAVTRLLTDDGLIVGICYAPSLHGEERAGVPGPFPRQHHDEDQTSATTADRHIRDSRPAAPGRGHPTVQP